MTKPDRITRAVAKLYLEERVGPWHMNEARFIEVVGNLLRREAAYQRARMRKIVVKEFLRMAGHPVLVDVLAALKGKEKR
jgi:hypothetical protein